MVLSLDIGNTTATSWKPSTESGGTCPQSEDELDHWAGFSPGPEVVLKSFLVSFLHWFLVSKKEWGEVFFCLMCFYRPQSSIP